MDFFYDFGEVKIVLPGGHMLPLYQKNHLQYDRFLPFLSKFLQVNELIVDVGANVGDTIAGMAASNSKLEFLCIEGDGSFFSKLVENIERMRGVIPELNVTAVNALVGAFSGYARLEGGGGSKHAVMDSGGDLQTQTLENIVSLSHQDRSIRLLKSDVDGYDYDVIRSAGSLLVSGPLVYFECQHENGDQRKNFKELFDFLKDFGYNNFAFFDNFGQYILTLNEADQIKCLLDYVMKQNLGKGTRTMYYYDVLAFKEKDRDLVSNVINRYVEDV